MASIYDLKPKFQALLRPPVSALAQAGVSANAVTVSALVVCIAYGALIAATAGAPWVLVGAPAVFFLRMAMNAVDGMLAREHDMKSPLGALLNEGADLAADAAIYLPFAFVAGVDAGLLIAAATIGLIAEGVGLAAVQIGASRRYDGPFGKSDRAFFFGALAFAIGIGLAPGAWTSALLAAACAAGLLTIRNRGRAALREARDAA